jgi:hypothetical protein
MSSADPRDRRRRLLRGANCHIAGGENDVDAGLDQFRRNFRKLLIAEPEAARIDRQILPFDKAKAVKLGNEHGIRQSIAPQRRQWPELIHTPRLLRPGCARQLHRAGQQQQKVAPLTRSPRQRGRGSPAGP